MKLKDLPINEKLYKDPELLEPTEKSEILGWLRATAARYRALRAKLAKEKGDDKSPSS